MKSERSIMIGEKLKKLRNGSPQSEIAKNIGVSTMAISSYETGKRIPTDDIKVKIAKYFGRSIEDIFYAD